MAEELGKITKPPVDNFTETRKLIVVPLLFAGQGAPEDFMEIYNRCWNQIKEQIGKLETKLGAVSRIYHEMVFNGGDEGLQVLEQLNPDSHQLVRSHCDSGAQLEATDDAELAMENMDWERCLMVAMGQKVREKVAHFHRESGSARYAHISQRIDDTLQPREQGLLVVREGHTTQFPKDVQVFNVSPPALDELNRWLRDYTKNLESSETEAG